MKNIIIGITSGIACYKVIDLIKELEGYNIDVILTKNTLKMIPKEEFERLRCNVNTELFNKDFDYKAYLKNNKKIKHISIADKADILVIAPATANIIGKIANGVANDLLTTTVLAVKCHVLICPSMNCNMYNNPIVQGNIDKLKRLGYYFIEPEYGILACGYKGVGRLTNIKKIKKEIIGLLEKTDDLKGKRILVTAGPSSEKIDAVRVITNKSSGKMGIYIAEEAAKRGAEVTLLRGETQIEPLGNIKDIKIESGEELFNEVKRLIKKQDIMVHAAAVSDFKVNEKNIKIKSNKKINLKLKPTIKIIEQIKKINKKIFLVGFKAECGVSENRLVRSAKDLLKRSKADMIVANDIAKNPFGSDKNEVFIISKDKIKKIKLDEKRIIASRILDLI